MLRYAVIFAATGVSSALTWRLGWKEQVVAWPVTAGVLWWSTTLSRSEAIAAAPPVPDAGDLLAVELPASGRTGDLPAAAAAPVRAAGTTTLRGAIRNSRRAGGWHPAGDPEADRRALLNGQAFRVVALRRDGGRWDHGKLEIAGRPLTVTWKRVGWRRAGIVPLAGPSRIVLTRPVDRARDRFPRTNDWLFAVVKICTRDGQETLAIPVIDVPLVHAALELANAEGQDSA